MTVCWLVVNTLLGVGREISCRSGRVRVDPGPTTRPLFDTLAKTAVVPPADIGKLAGAKRRDYAPQFPACDYARGESAAGGAEP